VDKYRSYSRKKTKCHTVPWLDESPCTTWLILIIGWLKEKILTKMVAEHSWRVWLCYLDHFVKLFEYRKHLKRIDQIWSYMSWFFSRLMLLTFTFTAEPPKNYSWTYLQYHSKTTIIVSYSGTYLQYYVSCFTLKLNRKVPVNRFPVCSRNNKTSLPVTRCSCWVDTMTSSPHHSDSTEVKRTGWHKKNRTENPVKQVYKVYFWKHEQ